MALTVDGLSNDPGEGGEGLLETDTAGGVSSSTTFAGIAANLGTRVTEDMLFPLTENPSPPDDGPTLPDENPPPTDEGPPPPDEGPMLPGDIQPEEEAPSAGETSLPQETPLPDAVPATPQAGPPVAAGVTPELPAIIPPPANTDSSTAQLGIALLQGKRSEQQTQVSIVQALLPGRPRPQTDLEPTLFARARGILEKGFRVAAVEGEEGEGAIAGRVFEDANGNGFQDVGEGGLSGQTVYLDRNSDGLYQEGEPAAVTNEKGEYRFSGLRLDTYTVRQALWQHIEQTHPPIALASPNGERPGHQVTLTPEQAVVTEKNFGTIQVNPVPPSQRAPAVRAPAAQTSPLTPTETGPPMSRDQGEDLLDRLFEEADLGQEEADPLPEEAVAELSGDNLALFEPDDAGAAAIPWGPLVVSAVALVYTAQLTAGRADRKRRDPARRLRLSAGPR